MYGLPPEFAQSATLDPSLAMMTAYMFMNMVFALMIVLGVGLVTLPIFFVVIFVAELLLSALSETGMLVFKVPLILLRGLRRSPLRTSLSFLALFVLTGVLSLVYSMIAFIGNVTRDKEANFKVIMTEKYSIPSLMPPAYEERMKRLLEELPPELRPAKGDDDLIAWSFVGGTTDPNNPKPENALFMFCVDPRKIPLMMDGLEKKDLTDEEYSDLLKHIQMMQEDPRRILVDEERLTRMNLRIGQKIKLSSMNFKDIVFEFEVIGLLPKGKYARVGFCSRLYLDNMLKAYQSSHGGQAHMLADKCVNLIWVRVPNKEAHERLAAMVADPKNFSSPAAKLETASAGIGTFLEAYKDIFFGMKYILAPAMVAIMSLVIANAISIGVRERRTEMAVLKVLGFQPWHVMGMVLGEAVLIGVLAGGMSTFLAWFCLDHVKFQIAFLGAFKVPIEVLVYGPVLGAAVAIVGSLGPALSAKNVKVAEVFAKTA